MQLKEADKFLHTTRQDTVIIEEKSSNGTVIHRYTKGKFLGKGGFAKCYELISLENDKKYAVKAIEKASLTRSKAKEVHTYILLLYILYLMYISKRFYFFNSLFWFLLIIS